MKRSFLAVGAAAAVLGATLGMVVPETERENEWMGEARETAVDKAQQAATGAASRVKEAAADAVTKAVVTHADELTALDQAIGDGDHGINMKRGFEAVAADATLTAKPWPDFLKGVGMTLVMKVGGASGPLFGTLFMTLGKELPAEPTAADVAGALRAAIVAQSAGAKQPPAG